MPDNNETMKYLLRHLLWRIHPGLLQRLTKYSGQCFSIGIYEGKDLFSLNDAYGITNPVFSAEDIDDVPADFVADPFVVPLTSKQYLFCEVFNRITRRGEIGLATSPDGLTWNYASVVLKEPFHLSYPYVFNWNDDFYMIPETQGSGIRLYRARRFPDKWALVREIVVGDSYVDSSILHFEDRWWLFTAQTKSGSRPETLHLFFAEEPIGPWKEHPANPITSPADNVYRPAGKILFNNGKPIRFAQKGFPQYGSSVHAYEIVELSPRSYKDRKIVGEPILSGGNDSWNRGGMHHIDAHAHEDDRWLAYVDGWYMKR